MNKILYFFLFFLIVSCSNDETSANTQTDESIDKSYIILNGIKSPITHGITNTVTVKKQNNCFKVFFIVGTGFMWHKFDIILTDTKDIISVKDESYTNDYNWSYFNYRNFPKNYYNVEVLEFDDISRKIKLKLSGFLYTNSNNINSEKITSEIYIEEDYEIENDFENYLTPNSYDGINSLDYCKSKINTTNWIARKEYIQGEFSASDEFLIKFKFDPNAALGNYSYNSSSTNNCISFKKFNTSTFQYDDFITTGNLNLTYKEFHGLINFNTVNSYSFFGDFNFTATNPSNPSEVYQVSNGSFRTKNPY